ncbi:MAG: hypothetical protein CMC82_00880 [Flavobacteriaceae bacterium]|nr:hypothetical protein [Flavobacteriaceae bacterium]|tara:strand:+ start:6350 stop:7525 length:1176 start_codon:yes stop_codon:yes gene_type:complete
MKKICIVIDSPIQDLSGASLRLYYEYINFFLLRHKVTLIYFSKYPKKKKWPRKIPKNLELLSFEKASHLLPNKFNLINQLDHKDKIKEIVDKKKISMIIAFDIVSASQVIRCDNSDKIIWLGDLRFQTNFYNFFYSVKENIFNLRHLFYNLIQNYHLRRFYIKNLKKFKKIVVSSDASRSCLLKMGFKSYFLPYPWPKQFKTINKANVRVPSYLFFGNLSGLGSRSSINELLFKIYPKLKKKIGPKKFKIFIGGLNLEKSYLAKIDLNEFPEIFCLGFIRNIEDIASKCVAMIFPGNVPVGNRCRLISCLASKILIIAHKSCILGNPSLIDSKTALIASDSNQFVEQMIKAFKNRDLCELITSEGQKVYYENYEPDKAGKILEDFIYEKTS